MIDDKLILAIDQGTTSTRALVFNKGGKIVAKAHRDLPLITPQSGWVEQNANQIWNDVVAVCQDALKQEPIDNVIGIGITNQRETTIVWDRETGEPVYNAIVWQDRRTAEFCKNLKKFEPDIQARTGLLADPYFSATKIKWILDQVDDASNLIFGTVDSYLLWKLTEGRVHATDISNAARTMLFNIHDCKWDDDQCAMMNVPMGMLPTVMDNCADFGVTNIFGKSIPILAMAGDQQSATFGQACFDDGMIKSTYGTGCFALMNTGDKPVISKNKLLSTIAWRINGKTTYALEGSIFVAGAAVQFLRDNLNFFDDSAQSETLARSVDHSDGVVFVPAFTGLGAPYWNPDVRGAIMGLSRGTTTAHITRAALEAQAFQTRDLMGAFTSDAGMNIETIRVDGGLVANDFVCQQIANQTGVKIDRPFNTEATVWGAAAMAFLQAGEFKSLDDIAQIYELETSFMPDASEQSAHDDAYGEWMKCLSSIDADV